MKAANAKNPWSVTVRVDDVGEAGRHIDLEADEATRAAVARAANLEAIEALSAAFDLTRRGRDGLRAVGEVRAEVRQACVVTLDPVVSRVEEAIDVAFAPPREAEAARTVQEDDEEPVAGTVAGEDPPEPLIGGTVDLGALAIEFLLLGIDPYPRKAGVTFAAPPAGDSTGHPFAALAALKKPNKVKD